MSIVAQCVVAALSTVVLICTAVALESTHPSSRRIAKTVVFNTVCALLIGAWARILQPIASAEARFLKAELGFTPLPLPEHGWPVWFSALVVMLAADLIFYWVHRAQHRYDFLWAMHSFHHSDDDLNVTSGYRHYWLEKPFWMLVFYIPLGLVFRISPETASAFGVIFVFFAMFPHSNVRLELGPFTQVLLGPQLHRIHHSVQVEHYNTNFCGAFPIWDLLFGTYRAPAAGEFPETGVTSATSRPRPLHALLWPVYRLSSQDEQSVE